MAVNKFLFNDVVEYKDQLMKQQEKRLKSLYSDWAKELSERSRSLSKKHTNSAILEAIQLKQLQTQIEETAKNISNEIYSTVKNNAYLMVGSVQKANANFMASLGFPAGASTVSIDHRIVASVLNGTIYKKPWSLSKAIWGDNQKTLSDIRTVLARGIAENKPVFKIAKDLENYVNPNKGKMWNPRIKMFNKNTGKFEYQRIYKRQVDYNAQRLARTTIQHSYQQAMIDGARNNPFVEQFLWEATGSRPCPICQDLDGTYFKKGYVPLDHPCGQCTISPVLEEDIEGKLNKWLNEPDGTYPDIDKFAREFGYLPDIKKAVASNVGQFNDYQNEFLKPLGYSPEKMPKNFNEFKEKHYFKDIVMGKDGMFNKWQKAVAKEYPNLGLGKANEMFFDEFLAKVETKLSKEIIEGVKDVTKKKLDDFINMPWYKAKKQVGKNWYKAEKHMASKGMSPSAYWKQYVSGQIKDGTLDDILGFAKKEISSGEQFALKYGKSNGKTFNYWYTKLDDAAKAEAKALKEESGLTWQGWYEKYIQNKVQPKSGIKEKVIETKHKITDRWKKYIDDMRDKQNVEMMLKREEKSLAKLTQKQLAAVETYSGSAYTEMNEYLRLIGKGMKHEEAMKKSGINERLYNKIQDAIKGLSKTQLEEETILRRGTDLGDLAGFMDGDFWKNFRKLQDMSLPELQKQFEGTIGTYHSFTSTSSIFERGFDGNVEMIIRAPKGTQGSSIMSISRYGTDEGETLLNAGTRILIEKIEASDGHMSSQIRVFARIIVDK